MLLSWVCHPDEDRLGTKPLFWAWDLMGDVWAANLVASEAALSGTPKSLIDLRRHRGRFAFSM